MSELTKVCTRCKIEQPITNFYVANSKAHKNNPVAGYKCRCKKCVLLTNQEYYKTEKGYKKIIEKSWKENGIIITIEEYDILLESQGGGCAICGATSNSNGTRLCVDHCHTTGSIRGILCHNCNTTLGRVNDDIRVLQKCIDYLNDKKEAE